MSQIFTQLASDNFQRPNESPLNPANWFVYGGGMGSLAIVSNLCVGELITSGGEEAYTGITFPNDQYASITVSVFNTVGEVYPVIRSSLDGLQSYFVDFQGNGDGTTCDANLYKDTVPNLISGPVTIPILVSGNVITLSAIGTLLTVFVNGVSIISANDSSLVSGYPGAGVFQGSTQTDTSLSLFAAGRAALPPAHYSQPDCRNFGQFPNTAVNVNGTLTYTTPTHSSKVAPVDSRTNKPVASGTYPQNSRAPGTFGPGE